MNTESEVTRIISEVRERKPIPKDALPFLCLVIEAWEETWGHLRMKSSDGKVGTAKEFLYGELDKQIRKKMPEGSLTVVENIK